MQKIKFKKWKCIIDRRNYKRLVADTLGRLGQNKNGLVFPITRENDATIHGNSSEVYETLRRTPVSLLVGKLLEYEML